MNTDLRLMNAAGVNGSGVLPAAIAKPCQAEALPGRLLGLLLLWLLMNATNAAPVISEFMADNASGLADEDGTYADWIELWNPDAGSVNLAGYALTDDAAVPMKWIFPVVSLAAGERLVVFASGKDRRVVPGRLHTNFALAKGGGYLGLRDASGGLVSAFAAYPPQRENRSYGRRGSVLVEQGAACRWWVPHAPMPGWADLGFTDILWRAGTSGIGYDLRIPLETRIYTSLLGKGSDSLLAGDLFFGRDSADRYSSVYVRWGFEVAGVAQLSSLTLRMRYDDGFVAWLNGSKVAAQNVPTNTAWNSLAASSLNSTDWWSIDLTSQKNLLVPGRNVLAIQGVNRVVDSNDLLVLPELLVGYAPGGLTEGFLASPTPGRAQGMVFAGAAVEPSASVGRGFFSAPIAVQLTSPTVGATIRFTTNGAEPDGVSGLIYSGSIPVTTTMVLRARTFKPGLLPSETMTQTYVFPAAVKQQPIAPAGAAATWGTLAGQPVAADYAMNPAVVNDPAYSGEVEASLQALPTVSLVTTPSALLSDEGIYGDRRQERGELVEIPISMEFFAGPGVAQFQADAGLRMHGGNARVAHLKKPFRLYFRREYGPARLEFPLFSGSPANSFDQLVLHPGGHDGWAVPFGSGDGQLAAHASYVRDAFVRRTELAAGLPQVRGRFVQLYLNGLYWGIYDLAERPSAAFFAEREGGAEADWNVLHHADNRAYESATLDGEGSSWQALTALTDGVATDAAVAEAGKTLDLDAFCDHLIIRMWSADYDWMTPVFRDSAPAVDVGTFANKNWYAAGRLRGPSAQPFKVMSWDAEMSMGLHVIDRIPTPPVNPVPGQRVADFDLTQVDKYSFIDPNLNVLITVKTPAGLYAWLKQNESFRRRFSDRVQRIFKNGGVLDTPVAQARLGALRAEIESAMVAESARWGDVNGVSFTRNDHWRSEMDWLRDGFIGGSPGRTQRVLAQFRARGLYPAESTAVVWSQRGGNVPAGTSVTLTDPDGGTIYFTTDGSDPLTGFQSAPQQYIGVGAVVEVLVPSTSNGGSTLGTTWRDPAVPANSAQWRSGIAGVGYEATELESTFMPLPGIYAPWIGTAVPEMFNANNSVFIRVPFQLSAADLNGVNGLSLRMRFDDGFVAWINGQRVAAANAPSGELSWDDAAYYPDAGRDDVWAQTPWWYDVTAGIGALHMGTNVLAIQGLNNYTDSRDMLIDPQLIAERTTAGGALRGTATAYTTPILITGPVRLTARVLSPAGVWSALDSAWFSTVAPASAANVVVSEFSYRPTGPRNAAELAVSTGRADFEFIELMAVGTAAIDLTGLTLTEGVSCAVGSGPSAVLQPGEVALLVRNRAAFTARFGAAAAARIVAEFMGNDTLDNDGETITVRGADGNVIVSFAYADAAPWPEAADGAGFSLEMIAPAVGRDHAQPATWKASLDAQGSPGEVALDFTAWSARWWDAPNAASLAEADSDGDGLPNLVEFALGTNPLEATAEPVWQVALTEINGSHYLSARHPLVASRAGLLFTVERSVDLVHWETAGLVALPREGQRDGMRSTQAAETHLREWLRLKAAINP